jgi:LCP family protein required for cell wall assembly
MKSVVYNLRDKKNLITEKGIFMGKISLVIFLIMEILFASLLIVTNILPFKMLMVVMVILFVFAFIVLKMILSKGKRPKSKIGTILAIIGSIILLAGNIYLYSTYDLFHTISKSDQQTEDIYLVTLADSKYKSIDDIDGKTVFVLTMETDSYKQAKSELKDEYNLKYEKCSDYLTLGYKLVSLDGKTYDNIIMLSAENYEMLCEQLENFESQTKILYTKSVKLKKVNIVKDVDVTKDTFNVYISGIDTYGDISKVARSDMNLIATINPRAKKILLTSIPRDAFVTLHTYGKKDKLTHSGNYGIRETVTTVEDFLGIEINYYLRVNFTTLEDVVTVLDGINVYSPVTFTTRYSNGNYTFTKGRNYLDGEHALAFARERYAFADGDNERVRNQQRVLEAIIDKITTDKSVLIKYPQLLAAIKDEIQTNMSDSDIADLIKMQLKDMSKWDIKTIAISGEGIMSTTYSAGSQKLYVMIPDQESVAAARTAIKNMKN